MTFMLSAALRLFVLCEREAWRVDTADYINIQNAMQPYAGGVCSHQPAK